MYTWIFQICQISACCLVLVGEDPKIQVYTLQFFVKWNSPSHGSLFSSDDFPGFLWCVILRCNQQGCLLGKSRVAKPRENLSPLTSSMTFLRLGMGKNPICCRKSGFFMQALIHIYIIYIYIIKYNPEVPIAQITTSNKKGKNRLRTIPLDTKFTKHLYRLFFDISTGHSTCSDTAPKFTIPLFFFWL